MIYLWRYSHRCHILLWVFRDLFSNPPYPFWEGNFDLAFELQLVEERYLAPFLSTQRQSKCKRNIVISLKIAKVTRHGLFGFVNKKKKGGGDENTQLLVDLSKLHASFCIEFVLWWFIFTSSMKGWSNARQESCQNIVSCHIPFPCLFGCSTRHMHSHLL